MVWVHRPPWDCRAEQRALHYWQLVITMWRKAYFALLKFVKECWTNNKYGTQKGKVKAFSLAAKLNLQKEAENALSLLMWDSFTGNLLRSLELFLIGMLLEQCSNTNFIRKHLGKARNGGFCLQQTTGLDCISFCKDVPEIHAQHRKIYKWGIHTVRGQWGFLI